MDESDARNALVMESESCSIDDEEEDSALWMRTMWLMAKGQRRRETFMEARMVRSGRKMIRQPVSLTFIQGVQLLGVGGCDGHCVGAWTDGAFAL